ncbi:MAG: phospholipase [Alphaproteobacteria bacterium]|nr:phospholipase [Alphaproteobacteria bacterium]
MAFLPKLSGPRLPPAGGVKAERLVILLHGYGADGNDLIGLAPHWARILPGTAFVAPHAPERCELSPSGFQWFSLGAGRTPQIRTEGVRKAAPVLEAFIDQELARAGLDEDRLALVGFSQGTMMALHVALRRPRAVAGVLGFSGMLVGGETLKAEVKSRPPVFLIHGDADDMIPLTALFESTQGLGAAEVAAEWHISRGIPHAIGPDGLALGGDFLRRCFSARRG